MKLPTNHPESKNGWNGSNNDDIEHKPCSICGHYNVEKVYYHSDPHDMTIFVFDCEGGPYLRTVDHIVVCWECSKTLSDGWYGCGCGG